MNGVGRPQAGAVRRARPTARRIAWLAPVALVAACTGGGDGMRASLAHDDPREAFWAIRATCEGGRFEVDFRPGEQLSAAGLGFASSDEVGVECGDPERVVVTDEELRQHTPSGADLAAPAVEPTRLSCAADGPLVVSAHPVRTEYLVVGGGLRVERDGHAVVAGATMAEGYDSQLQWWGRYCKPVG